MSLGLWWLDIPAALALGLIAGLLEFIPSIGQFLAAVPILIVVMARRNRHGFCVVA